MQVLTLCRMLSPALTRMAIQIVMYRFQSWKNPDTRLLFIKEIATDRPKILNAFGHTEKAEGIIGKIFHYKAAIETYTQYTPSDARWRIGARHRSLPQRQVHFRGF